MNTHLVSYAQNREDIILDGFFDGQQKGFYVDIGAFDPDMDSVTKLFYQKGWTGINVEPQPDRYKFFVKRRPKDINLNLGISNKPGTLQLRSYTNQGLSTFSEKMKHDYERHKDDGQTAEFKDIPVQVINLKQLFDQNKVTSIQFMKVDVEGLEYEVLSGNDWQKYRPEVICIEANHIQKDWRGILLDNGYALAFFDGLNDYYVDKSSQRSHEFDYVQAVVFKEPIVHYQLLAEFKRYDKTVAWLDSENKKLRTELDDTRAFAEQLQHTLNEVTPLRRHLKRFVRYNLGRVDQKLARSLTRKNNFAPTPVAADQADAPSALSAARESDRNNFANFNRVPPQHPALPVYKATRTVALKTLSKARSIKRRRA